ncbi:MAG: ASCH domain-containing protein [Clostridia bacterium]|nr:ASCH domain-containing protein [Clostridia bacterium]
MNKAVMISIHPKWCELIANGKKTFEVRKTKPKLQPPFKVYIYCTQHGKQFFHGGISGKQNLFKNPDTGKIKFDYAFELMVCEKEYTEDNILSGKVIGEFVCDKIEIFRYDALYMAYMARKYRDAKLVDEEFCVGTQVSYQEAYDYCEGMTFGDIFYGWHISNLVIYDKPKELNEFCRNGECDKCGWFENGKCYKKSEQSTYNNHRIKRPPQSWCYVEEQDNE